MNAQSIFEAALTLPDTERARLVERLLNSLGPGDEPMWEEECAAELRHRSGAFAGGGADPVPWSGLKKRVL